jgi:hypothetical protein
MGFKDIIKEYSYQCGLVMLSFTIGIIGYTLLIDHGYLDRVIPSVGGY